MVDDKVFDGKPSDSPPNPETPPASPAPPPPGGLTKEEAASLVAEQIAPVKQGLQQMNEFFAKLQEQAATPPPKQDDGGEDWATKFYNDPQGTVQGEIASRTAPALQQAATTMGKVLLDQQQAQIDRDYGPGTWAELFSPKLDPIVASAAKENPMSLMSATAVENAVKTIKGDNFDALVERRQKLAESAADPNEELIKQTADRVVEMTGGIRRAPTAPQERLDDEESQEFLKSFFQHTGEQPEPARLVKLMNAGNYLDDWKAATKEDK